MAMFNRKLLVYQRVCRVCYIKPSNLGVLVVLSTYISSMYGAVFRTLLVVVEITTVGVVKHVHPPPLRSNFGASAKDTTACWSSRENLLMLKGLTLMLKVSDSRQRLRLYQQMREQQWSGGCEPKSWRVRQGALGSAMVPASGGNCDPWSWSVLHFDGIHQVNPWDEHWRIYSYETASRLTGMTFFSVTKQIKGPPTPSRPSFKYFKGECCYSNLCRSFDRSNYRTVFEVLQVLRSYFLSNHLVVSWKRGTPKSSNGIFHCKPTIFRYPHLWKPPFSYRLVVCYSDVVNIYWRCWHDATFQHFRTSQVISSQRSSPRWFGKMIGRRDILIAQGVRKVARSHGENRCAPFELWNSCPILQKYTLSFQNVVYIDVLHIS